MKNLLTYVVGERVIDNITNKTLKHPMYRQLLIAGTTEVFDGQGITDVVGAGKVFTDPKTCYKVGEWALFASRCGGRIPEKKLYKHLDKRDDKAHRLLIKAVEKYFKEQWIAGDSEGTALLANNEHVPLGKVFLLDQHKKLRKTLKSFLTQTRSISLNKKRARFRNIVNSSSLDSESRKVVNSSLETLSDCGIDWWVDLIITGVLSGTFPSKRARKLTRNSMSISDMQAELMEILNTYLYLRNNKRDNSRYVSLYRLITIVTMLREAEVNGCNIPESIRLKELELAILSGKLSRVTKVAKTIKKEVQQ